MQRGDRAKDGAMDVMIDHIREAADRLQGIAIRTPLLPLNGSDADGIWIKPEVLQPIGSYKMRGAFNALSKRLDHEQLTEATTLSSGNMAQAVAWSARKLGLHATAIMLDSASEFKIQATREYGAEIELIPFEPFVDAFRDSRYDHRPGFLHPFNDPDVMAGQGTIGLEIIEDAADVETIIAPVGGGGLVLGIATAIKALRPGVKVFGVQPAGAAGLAISLAAGEPRTMPWTTFVDGAGSPNILVEALFPAFQRLTNGCLTVHDDDTKAAIYRLATRNKLVTEGAGALSVAAALRIPAEERGKTVCIISGGSIDSALLGEILLTYSA